MFVWMMLIRILLLLFPLISASQSPYLARCGNMRLQVGQPNVLIVYEVPEDGYYDFSLEGGFRTGATSVIYYCEYNLDLKSDLQHVVQPSVNIASQAQDGDVCDFRTNLKNNAVSGIFHQGEKVQLRFNLQSCEVNGQAQAWVRTVQGSRVRVRQLSPAYVKDP